MISPFKGLKDKTTELEIGGQKIKVKPKVADAELFLTMKQEMNEETAKIPSRVMTAMIKRANPEEDPEDIQDFIVAHYGELMMKIAPLFGFKVDTATIEKQLKKKE